jgi:serine phosphatase RsbU (regulator of sigma subunit)
MALRISDDQAKVLGIAEHIPPKVRRATNLDEKGQNKLEAKYDRYLADLKHAGLIRDYYFEAVKFRLAARTFYTPDFVVVTLDGATEVRETKGFFREDARVKIKVAAEKYPHIRWVVVRWVGGEWEYETIRGRGTA